MLVNYRPEYRHEWGNKGYYTQLRLDPLGADSAGEMLEALLDDGGELVSLRRLIIDKTEGNPFFIEELVKALFEQGALRRNGNLKLTQSLAEIKIPPTVQAVLASRIDRLGSNEKDLLQTLAVVGRKFALSLIRRVIDSSEVEVDRFLAVLQGGEFIYEQPAFPDVGFIFKHALTQEVAYNSVLIERRKILHERIANGIESLHENQLDEHFDELAYHYSRSDNASKAVEYLRLASEQALARSRLSEAIA